MIHLPARRGAKGPRVVVDARIRPGQVGGVESAVLGLARGLSGLVDGDEECLFLSYVGENDWLRQNLPGNASTLEVDRPEPKVGWRRTVRTRAPTAGRMWDRVRSARANGHPPAPSEGALVGAGAQVLQHLALGPDATVGAGAVVTRDVGAGVTVVGVPARPKARDGRVQGKPPSRS